MKIKASSTGAPPPASAAAFARLLLASVERKPDLKLVKVEKKERAA